MDRICNLYVDKTHLSITLLEYIKKEFENGTKIIIISQDDIKKDIKSIKEKLKMKNNDNKEKIQFLDSINQKLIEKLDNVTVIIQGDADFVIKTEDLFSKMNLNDDMKVNIVSCYDISKSNDISEVVEKYDKMLNTNGVLPIK